VRLELLAAALLRLRCPYEVLDSGELVSLPVLVAGFATQDKLVQGLSLGAVK
jgi:hypothetical protein